MFYYSKDISFPQVIFAWKLFSASVYRQSCNSPGAYLFLPHPFFWFQTITRRLQKVAIISKYFHSTSLFLAYDITQLQVSGAFIPTFCVFPGALTVGLVRQCQTIHGRDRTCIPPRLPPEWVTTLFFIIMGIISLTVTCGLLVASHWRREATKYARWIAFTGMILFCMAALIFPIGFYINEVGGQPYKLPNNTVVGSSYVLFVLSIFFTIVGLLFAGKVCLPG
uniref:Modulator of smoothened protein n=1 Tax=Marmota marmota marmota TaxID=9994 RepID=A0A8C6AA17_MARMA